MKSIAIIALSTLALVTQTSAQFLTFSAPTDTTQWTAGQPATISWTNSCNQKIGNTTPFPVYLQHQVGQLQIPVPDIPVLGHLYCNNLGEITVQVPATLPQGNSYSILVSDGGNHSYSALFTILSAIPGPTTTTTTTIVTTVIIGVPTITTTVTIDVPSTKTPAPHASSTHPPDTGYTPPELETTKSNGPVIGGAIAGVVVVSAIIAFVLFRRRQERRGSGDSEAFTSFNPVPPSMSNADEDFADQDEPPSIDRHELKVATMHGPQIKPASPQSAPTPFQQDSVSSPTSTYSSIPWVTPGPTLPSSPQAIVNKNPHAAYLNRSPQNDLAKTSYVVRSPQLASPELVSAVPTSYHDLQEQINWMQAELNRRQPISE